MFFKGSFTENKGGPKGVEEFEMFHHVLNVLPGFQFFKKVGFGESNWQTDKVPNLKKSFV